MTNVDCVTPSSPAVPAQSLAEGGGPRY